MTQLQINKQKRRRNNYLLLNKTDADYRRYYAMAMLHGDKWLGRRIIHDTTFTWNMTEDEAVVTLREGLINDSQSKKKQTEQSLFGSA